MATIALYANMVNEMPWMVKEVKKSVTDYKSDLLSLERKALSVNGSICNLDDVIDSIRASSQTQERQADSLDVFNQNSEQFIADVVNIDRNVADIIEKNKVDFYNKYNYLKPECEKNGWEKFKDGCKTASEWCKEHWKLIATTIIVVAAIAVIVFCSAAVPLLFLAAKGAIFGALSGGLMGGISSFASGGSFWEGVENGAFSGVITGAIFGGIGGAGQMLGNSCQVLKKLGGLVKIVPHIAKLTGLLSAGMGGFDLLAFGLGIFAPNNPIVLLNQRLHSSTLYNAFQISVSAIAAFTIGFNTGMKTAVCFAAGTMVLTATALVAIEKIKAGDKVFSTNIETGENGEKPVLKTFINESNELVHVFLNGEKISTTPGHLFYAANKGWIPASNLHKGSILMLSDSRQIEVERIVFERLEEPIKVYNFEVADWHTYYVGNTSVLVHNDCIENKVEGMRREAEVEAELLEKYPEGEGYEIKKEALLRDSAGRKLTDAETGTGRRIDFVVEKNGTIVDSIEVTSQSAPKDLQIAKELRIRANGGNYIRFKGGNLIKIPEGLLTRIIRRD